MNDFNKSGSIDGNSLVNNTLHQYLQSPFKRIHRERKCLKTEVVKPLTEVAIKDVSHSKQK